jgi:hypothetical protein
MNDESKAIGITIGRITGNRICSRNCSVLNSSDGLKKPPNTSTVHGKKSVIKNEEISIEATRYLLSERIVAATALVSVPPSFLPFLYFRRITSKTIAGSIFRT